MLELYIVRPAIGTCFFLCLLYCFPHIHFYLLTFFHLSLAFFILVVQVFEVFSYFLFHTEFYLLFHKMSRSCLGWFLFSKTNNNNNIVSSLSSLITIHYSRSIVQVCCFLKVLNIFQIHGHGFEIKIQCDGF